MWQLSRYCLLVAGKQHALLSPLKRLLALPWVNLLLRRFIPLSLCLLRRFVHLSLLGMFASLHLLRMVIPIRLGHLGRFFPLCLHLLGRFFYLHIAVGVRICSFVDGGFTG